MRKCGNARVPKQGTDGTDRIEGEADPVAERHEVVPSFEAAARDYYEVLKEGWTRYRMGVLARVELTHHSLKDFGSKVLGLEPAAPELSGSRREAGSWHVRLPAAL